MTVCRAFLLSIRLATYCYGGTMVKALVVVVLLVGVALIVMALAAPAAQLSGTDFTPAANGLSQFLQLLGF
jgi:hypothetical protein